MNKNAPNPTEIVLHQTSKQLEIAFDTGERFHIPFELMRINSPSAEVQGHGPGQEVLQTGKRSVSVLELEPVGNYAVKPTFTDGHDTGLFTWEYLHFLGAQQGDLWGEYAKRLSAAGLDRDAPMPGKKGGGCG